MMGVLELLGALVLATAGEPACPATTVHYQATSTPVHR
jgi:hypothetical protein